MALAQEKIYTIDDIYALPDGQRAELIDGQIYMMTPPNRIHQQLSHFLEWEIENYIQRKKGECEVYAVLSVLWVFTYFLICYKPPNWLS